MTTVADDRAELNRVTVLIDLISIIVDSCTLISPANTKLSKDIAAIPSRLKNVLASDRIVRRTWKRKPEGAR